MKVQCDVCQRAEATVLCCADEAALCRACDEDVHAANKLAGKHQRVPLLHRSPSQAPSCDICQERNGYFFCLEDRALLCRQCDVGVHTASSLVSAHQRFLVTGVRVALHQCVADDRSNSSSCSGTGGEVNKDGSRSSSNPSSSHVASTAHTTAVAGAGTEEQPGGLQQQWEWGEILGGSEFEQYYGLSELAFSTKDVRR